MLRLPQVPVSEFKVQVMQWPQRKEGMSITVGHRKQADLPVWLFPDGANPLAVKLEVKQEVKEEVKEEVGCCRGPWLPSGS